MKKLLYTSLFSGLFLMISSIVCYFTKYLPIDNQWAFLWMGIGLLLIGLIPLIAGNCTHNDRLRIGTYIINAIALGFCIRAWYIFRGFDNPLWVMLVVSLVCVLYLWLFYLLLYIPVFNVHFVYPIFLIIFILLSIVAYVAVMCLTTTTYISTFGFYMIIEMGFIFALSRGKENADELFYDCAVSSYTVFIVAIMIALMMLSESGDSCDCDCSGCGGDGSGGGLVSPRRNSDSLNGGL